MSTAARTINPARPSRTSTGRSTASRLSHKKHTHGRLTRPTQVPAGAGSGLRAPLANAPRAAAIGSVRGGNDRLPNALAAALGHRLRYHSDVVRIAQGKRDVTVGYRDRGGLHEIYADRYVCALPFAPLRRVTIATWAGGGWGWTQPGELRWVLPAMRQVEGRVHFAGEHTSLWIAWMNGALESAERVVGEIVQAEAGAVAG
jgi:monoamine oxidase